MPGPEPGQKRHAVARAGTWEGARTCVHAEVLFGPLLAPDVIPSPGLGLLVQRVRVYIRPTLRKALAEVTMATFT